MRRIITTATALLAFLSWAPSAFAQETPYQRYELLWSGWMAIGFITFFTVSISFLVIAVKWGLLRDLEAPKYYMLTIDEPDYYSPDWGKEGQDAAPHPTGNQ